MTRFINQVIRVLQLDPLVYSEIDRDRSPLIQALILAGLSSIGSGVGNSAGYPGRIFYLSSATFGAWTIWAILIYVLGTKIFPEAETKTDMLSILRVTGFAATPGLIKLLAYLPAFSGIILFGATIWILGGTVVATKQVLHYHSMPRAIGITLLSWICYQLILFQL